MTMMAEGSPPHRVLRTALLDPIGEARALLRRLQSNEMFQGYLRERGLYALPLVAGVAMTGLALAGGAMAFIGRAGTLLALVTAIVFALSVLVGSVLVQAYVLLSWLEGRSLAKLQEHRRARDRGPAARWIARRLRIDLGPPPRVPWIPALALFVLPAAMLASVAPAIAAGLVVLQLVAAIIYARRDPVSGADHPGARRWAEAPEPSAVPPLPKIQVSAGADDLDFSSTAGQSGGGGLTRRIRSIAQSARRAVRSVGQSGRRGVRFVVQLCLLNLLPFVEYCALISGILVVWMGWQSAAEREIALGVGLVGGALLVGGLASIVTKRMSFRFYVDPRSGRAGVAAIIAGLMQLIAGGLAAAAAHALATHTWQARLDALAVNPWPLLLPLSLLLICAGLLMMRRSSDRVGPLGTVLYLVPKTLIAIAAVGAGAAILGGWGWKIYDPQAFQSYLSLVPDEYVKLLANGWKR
ncbi:MAG: hypothetical protein OEV97_03920 [Betaproteobacteria bacterium]|nr:hypothetical protein [Betaproteobacteria bacterium]